MTSFIIPPSSLHHDDVRLRNTDTIWNLEGLVGTNVPAGGEQGLDSESNSVTSRRMRWVFGHLGHQKSVDQMEPVALGEDPRVYHRLVLRDAQPIERRKRRNPERLC